MFKDVKGCQNRQNDVNYRKRIQKLLFKICKVFFKSGINQIIDFNFIKRFKYLELDKYKFYNYYNRK